MKYFLFDAHKRNNELILIFWKEFDYFYAIGLKERLEMKLINHVEDALHPIFLEEHEAYELDILNKGNYSQLTITDSKNKKIVIKCDKLLKQELENTKTELIGYIQDLEIQLQKIHSSSAQQENLLNKVKLFCKHEIDRAVKIIDSAKWLPDIKKAEATTKEEAMNQILNIIDTASVSFHK